MAVAQFEHRVRELTGRSWGVSMDHRLHKLGQYLRGWTAYFGISQYYRPVPELDDWIRRRIRMCYWKQWRWAHEDQALAGFGREPEEAIQHGVSSKSYWHMARTPALQQALSNAWLKTQRLVSVKDLWCEAQGYTTWERKLRRACRLVEPPTADPYGGWYGGWGLETPGYPIGPRIRHGNHAHFQARFSFFFEAAHSFKYRLMRLWYGMPVSSAMDLK